MTRRVPSRQTTRLHWQESTNINKKLLIPLAVVLALPGLYFGDAIPISVNRGLVPCIHQRGACYIQRHDRAWHLTNSHSFVEWYVGVNVAVQSAYTVWTIEHNETFKGGKEPCKDRICRKWWNLQQHNPGRDT